MWSTFIQLHKLLQKIRQLPITYCNSRDEFQLELNANSGSSSSSNNSIVTKASILIWIVSILNLKSILNQLKEETAVESNLNYFTLLKGFLNFYYIVLHTMVLGSLWTTRYKTKESFWMISQAYRNHLKRKSFQDKPPPLAFWFNLVLYSLASTFIGTIFLTSILPLIIDETPIQYLFKLLLPRQLLNLPFVRKLVKLMSPGLVAGLEILTFVEMWQMILFFTAGLYESVLILATHSNNLIIQPRKLKEFIRLRKLKYFGAILYFRSYNGFTVVFMPITVSVAFVLMVMATVVSIRFSQAVPLFIVVVYMELDFCTVVLTIYICNIIMSGVESSAKYLQTGQALGRAERKELRACLPIRLENGPLFDFKRRTLLRIFDEVVNKTIFLLYL